MINSYEIKTENNREVLYLYIDLDNEFSIKELKNNAKKIDENIKMFIKKNKIAFSGGMAVLIVNGLFAGSVFLKNDTKNNLVTQSAPIKEVISADKLKEILKLKDNIDIQNKENSIDENNLEVSNPEENNSTVASTSKSDFTSNSMTNNSTVENNQESQEIIDNNTYVNVRRSSGEVIRLELEEYIYGVVSAEMPAEFNSEALKAQAVISRTYTLKALSKNQTLSDNESTQSYKSDNELRSLWGSKYDSYSAKIRDAVNSTKGAYLSYNGTYIEAVFHSTSNGKTEEAKNVWGNSFPYLISVDSSYDTSNKSFFAEKEISYSELSSKLGTSIDKDTELSITERTEGDRVKTFVVNDKTFTGIKIRSLLGLRSADFEITKTDRGVIFKTKGYGHGVGLSQYGANGLANAGYNFDQILNHYYPGTSLNYQ